MNFVKSVESFSCFYSYLCGCDLVPDPQHFLEYLTQKFGKMSSTALFKPYFRATYPLYLPPFKQLTRPTILLISISKTAALLISVLWIHVNYVWIPILKFAPIWIWTGAVSYGCIINVKKTEEKFFLITIYSLKKNLSKKTVQEKLYVRK